MTNRSPDVLLREVKRLKAKATPIQPARQWTIALEEDEALSDELKAQLGPYDTVIIKRIAKGLISEDMKPTWGQSMACWQTGPRGIKKPMVIRQYGVDISNV